MAGSWRTRSLVGVVVALVAPLLAAVGPVVSAPAPEPVRLLVVGDSITHGSAGDWTWRYRLARHLEAAAVAVDLVGPRTDLWEESSDYADPAFDQDHAARWGMAFATMARPYDQNGIGSSIGELVARYHPDVVLELLGANDLTYFTGPAQTRDALRTFVDGARAADPDVDLVLGRLPQPWRPEVVAFNGLVDDLAATLDDPDGPRTVVARADAAYDRQEDTWDGAHPSARGEVRIAAAFEDALAALGLGPPAARPLPDVPRGPWLPPALAATGGVRSAALSWTASPGATEYHVWSRDVTAGGGWRRVAIEYARAATVPDLVAWHRVQLQVRPVKGWWVAESPHGWSAPVEVEVLGDALDVPAPTAAASPSGTATVAWAPVPGAASYAVQWRRLDQPDAWSAPVRTGATGLDVEGLTAATGYEVRVRAERAALASGYGTVSLTVPPPGSVSGVRVAALRHHRLRTRGTPVAGAATYTLRVAPAASCRRAPRAGRFAIAAAGLLAPQRTLRSRSRALWVRWVAVRDGVESAVGDGSTACARVRR